MRLALPWRRTPTIHHAAVAPLAAPVSGSEEGWGGLGGARWRGSTIKLAVLHTTLKLPQRLAGADAFSDRRRARAAARQQVRVSRGGCGGRQPLAAVEAPQANFGKMAKNV